MRKIRRSIPLVLSFLLSACSTNYDHVTAMQGNQEANLQAFCYGVPPLSTLPRVTNWRPWDGEWIYVTVVDTHDFHTRAICENRPEPLRVMHNGY